MATPHHRLLALDAYRGLIMLSLLCGGIFHSLKDTSWHWLYVQNDHVKWEGCVYWDLIQPSFMFMVGVAMPFAFARRRELGQSTGDIWRHVLSRAFWLIAVGILLDHVGAEKIQIGFIRVLQQIAIGYVLAAPFVEKSLKIQALAAGSILVGYHLLWSFNPWNGPGGPWAEGNQNIGSAFDFWMLGRNYSGFYVGMNAVPSTATILFGIMAGGYIRQGIAKRSVFIGLTVAGIAGVVIGLALGQIFPLIKRIWTPSFAVYAGGWTTLMLAAFYGIVEMLGWRKWTFPLAVVGMNCIAAYVIAGAFGQWFQRVSGVWISLLKPHIAEVWWPVVQKLFFVAFAWTVLYWLWRRKIFFKC